MTSGVRVLVVDDTRDIRMLLRLTLESDERFDVVGEAANGAEAIEAAGALQPDLIILDRHMPVLDGVEALPAIRRACPQAAILLFTAHADEATRQVALGSGADQVWSKLDVPLPHLADELTKALLARMEASGDLITLRLGPLPSGPARIWIPNTMAIVAAVHNHKDELGLDIPDTVTEQFLQYLREWLAVAEAEDEFFWAVTASAASARQLIECWAAIDSLADDQLARLQVAWSPPAGEPFFAALTQAVLDALAHHDSLQDLRASLQSQWGPPAAEHSAGQPA
jgi:CheY-like chemotaxis protein